MTDEDLPPEQISEALRLSTLLAERVLDALIMGRHLPGEQALALAKAARFLQDHSVEWPPLLRQAIHEMAKKGQQIPAPDPDLSKAWAEAVTGSLSRFFAKPRPERGQP